MIEKTYQPQEIESRVSAAWEQAEAFAAGRAERRGARPYCIVIPPPNVTGSLHMGHAVNNTLQDILCRFERMRGRDVLWQPGTDHAGIATQMVVERQMMERQEPNRRTIGREKFVAKVWAWKAESGDTIINQLKRLGASCDWSRERFTMDEGLSRAVIKVFVDLLPLAMGCGPSSWPTGPSRRRTSWRSVLGLRLSARARVRCWPPGRAHGGRPSGTGASICSVLPPKEPRAEVSVTRRASPPLSGKASAECLDPSDRFGRTTPDPLRTSRVCIALEAQRL